MHPPGIKYRTSFRPQSLRQSRDCDGARAGHTHARNPLPRCGRIR
jgi:hypothetical protein